MQIFVTGLCTLHWGRLEYGNIGNYYIIEPFFRELHRVFPDAEIVTTFQMTEDFREKERVKILPMDLFYSWEGDDVSKAYTEYGIAEYYNRTKEMPISTPFIDAVMASNLVVDLSGDMWGDYAEHVGKDRFLVELLKNRTVQLLNKPIVLFAGSQGPFTERKTRDFAQIAYENFTAVMAREPEAIANVEEYGFSIDNTELYACPAFLFEPAYKNEMQEIFTDEKIIVSGDERPTVGLVICGFNFQQGPYDKWPRDDEEFQPWVEVAEYIINHCNARVILLSHSNGFDLPPNFKIKPGRDYPIANRIYEILVNDRKVSKEDVHCVRGTYIPRETKAIVGQLDMLVTGRVHASVAAISQNVPTVFIRYTSSMKSSKIDGFAKLVELEEYVCGAEDTSKIIEKIDKCWINRNLIRKKLVERIPEVQNRAKQAFNDMTKLVRK